jgi:hypothetical protein
MVPTATDRESSGEKFAATYVDALFNNIDWESVLARIEAL